MSKWQNRCMNTYDDELDRLWTIYKELSKLNAKLTAILTRRYHV